jgi:hypothetical protein
MGFVAGGGYAVLTKKDTWVYQTSVTQQTFLQIAQILNIPNYVVAEFPIARAIHVYRGRFVIGAGARKSAGKKRAGKKRGGGNGRRKSTRKR